MHASSYTRASVLRNAKLVNIQMYDELLHIRIMNAVSTILYDMNITEHSSDFYALCQFQPPYARSS